MNSKIKTEMRQRNREYDKNGKSVKWKELKNKCKTQVKKAKRNFSKNFVTNLRKTDPRNWMASLKKLGKTSSENTNTTWRFIDESKNDQTLTEEISTYFANISAHFVPVDRTLLPIVQIGGDFVSEVNCLPLEHEIYMLLKTSKKTCAVPRDIPLKILNEFLPEFVRPITNIFCQSIDKGIYPTTWKTEYINVVPKEYPPSGYNELRNLSLTEYLSKRFEELILKGTPTVNGLLYYIQKYIDINQFAVAGASCSHALIIIIDFILKNTDKCEPPKAVVNLLADWSKAFNNVNHNIVMRILIFLEVPQWILRLVLSYLEYRKMIVRFRGCESIAKDIPGSAPQGTLLGVFLYILYINPICFPGEVTLELHEILTSYWEKYDIGSGPIISELTEKLPSSMNAAKFMDDATCQEIIDINTCLASKLDRSGPLPFYESSGKILPGENSRLQNEIENIKLISDQREMVLNAKKNLLICGQLHRQSPIQTTFKSSWGKRLSRGCS